MPEQLRVLDLFSGIPLAASPSGSSGSDSEPLPSASSILSVEPSSASTGQKSNRLKTYRREGIAEAKDRSSQRDSHAKTSATLASAPALQATVQGYGGKLYEPFAWFDPGTGYWRTWQRCLVEGWARFSETWPRSGMTRNGIAYQLPTLASPTLGIESGLLPTIGANESKGSQRSRYLGSTEYRGAKMSEGLRTGVTDPIYTDPSFAEAAMGYPRDWTLLETPSLLSSPKSSDAS